MPDCLFCRIASKEVPAQLLHEDEQAVVFKDINPQAPTHFLVIPKKHIGSLSAATDGDAALLGHLQRVCVETAKKGVIVVLLSPGQVNTTPGMKLPGAIETDESVGKMLKIIDGLTPGQNGKFLNYEGGEELPW